MRVIRKTLFRYNEPTLNTSSCLKILLLSQEKTSLAESGKSEIESDIVSNEPEQQGE